VPSSPVLIMSTRVAAAFRAGKDHLYYMAYIGLEVNELIWDHDRKGTRTNQCQIQPTGVGDSATRGSLQNALATPPDTCNLFHASSLNFMHRLNSVGARATPFIPHHHPPLPPNHLLSILWKFEPPLQERSNALLTGYTYSSTVKAPRTSPS